jgi:hypothetical protein
LIVYFDRVARALLLAKCIHHRDSVGRRRERLQHRANSPNVTGLQARAEHASNPTPEHPSSPLPPASISPPPTESHHK